MKKPIHIFFFLAGVILTSLTALGLIYFRYVQWTSTPLLQKINHYRTAHNLHTVQIHKQLSQGAQERAEELKRTNTFQHIPHLSSVVWSSLFYQQGMVGEILSRYYTDDTQKIEAWGNSASHSAVLLDPVYRYVGIGQSDTYTVVWFSERW